MAAMVMPLREIGLSILVGALAGLLLSLLIKRIKNSSESFAVGLGVIMACIGLSESLHLSLIMTNMIAGLVLVNTRRQAQCQKVTRPLHSLMPILFILFFTLAGSHLEFSALPSLGWIGLVYILTRTTGLMGGAYLGGTIGKVEGKIRKYIGMGILSQAGVAIGLSLIIKSQLDQMNNPHAAAIGVRVLTTITATCIFFEIIGPILTKKALKKAGEITVEQSHE